MGRQLAEKGMAQYQLYMRSGVPKSTIGGIANGVCDPVKPRALHEPCQGLGIGLNMVFGSPLLDENNLEPRKKSPASDDARDFHGLPVLPYSHRR